MRRVHYSCRFCVGDRFYLIDNKILCEYDYEERLIFANMSSNSASLAQIQRRVTDIQVRLFKRTGGGEAIVTTIHCSN